MFGIREAFVKSVLTSDQPMGAREDNLDGTQMNPFEEGGKGTDEFEELSDLQVGPVAQEGARSR
jgi:hypothetical protein